MGNKNNPPAFPVEGQSRGEQVAIIAQGMSLRDYFAAKAIQATLSSGELRVAAQKTGKEFGLTGVQAVAKDAYEFADAMLAERMKTPTP